MKCKRAGGVLLLVNSVSVSSLKIVMRESSELKTVTDSGMMSDHREISKKFFEVIDNDDEIG
jgi:hypothetical protein